MGGWGWGCGDVHAGWDVEFAFHSGSGAVLKSHKPIRPQGRVCGSTPFVRGLFCHSALEHEVRSTGVTNRVDLHMYSIVATPPVGWGGIEKAAEGLTVPQRRMPPVVGQQRM